MEQFNELLHKMNSFNKYRPSIRVRRDAFYEYLPSQSDKDQEVLARMANTLVDLTDECFNACVDGAHKYYTYAEEKCMKECVQTYFYGFEKVTLAINKQIKE